MFSTYIMRICRVTSCHPWAFWVKKPNPRWRPTVKNLKFHKSKMAAAAILKNLKRAISRPRFNRFWRNLPCWCSSILFTVPTVKKLKLWKSKMAAAAILKNQNRKSPYLGRYSVTMRTVQSWTCELCYGQIPCSTERNSCSSYLCNYIR